MGSRRSMVPMLESLASDLFNGAWVAQLWTAGPFPCGLCMLFRSVILYN